MDPDRIPIVSLTTYKPYKEDACLLDRGDHRSISHQTCIAYGLAKMRPLADFQTLIDSDLLIPDDPVTPEVLDRIRQGIWRSKKLSEEHFLLMDGQGLL